MEPLHIKSIPLKALPTQKAMGGQQGVSDLYKDQIGRQSGQEYGSVIAFENRDRRIRVIACVGESEGATRRKPLLWEAARKIFLAASNNFTKKLHIFHMNREELCSKQSEHSRAMLLARSVYVKSFYRKSSNLFRRSVIKLRIGVA